MSEFKGTKGIWDYEIDEFHNHATVHSLKGGVICEIYYTDFNMSAVPYDFNLVSKAPEMLDMLIEMKSAMLELMNHQDGWEDDYTKLCELIESATNLK